MTNDSNNPDGPPVWFITGCSTGFGRELARCVLARGARAVLTARDKARVVDLAQGHSERCLVLDLDVTDNAQIAAAVAAAHDRFGRIDVLVNNAGYGYQAAVEEGDDREIRAMFDTNVFGLFAMTRAVLPGMRYRGGGQIALLSSLAAYHGLPLTPAYSASKAALKAYGEALRGGLAPLGIWVNVVMPGYVDSAMCRAMPGPKPFVWSAARAARVIRRGLAANRARITFPWLLAFGCWWLAVLPAAVSGRILRLLRYGP